MYLNRLCTSKINSNYGGSLCIVIFVTIILVDNLHNIVIINSRRFAMILDCFNCSKSEQCHHQPKQAGLLAGLSGQACNAAPPRCSRIASSSVEAQTEQSLSPEARVKQKGAN